MPFPPLPTRFAREKGTRASLRIYWSRGKVTKVWTCKGPTCFSAHVDFEDEPENAPGGCPNSWGTGKPGSTHNAYAPLGETEELGAWDRWGKAEDHATGWPTACEHCGAPVPEVPALLRVGDVAPHVRRQVFVKRLYDTPSGRPEPGSLYWVPCYSAEHPGEGCFWANCPGRHLHVVLPNGHDWDIDSRASNCARPDDRKHRCWVRTGDPERGKVDVGKGGRGAETCPAGGGSIGVPGYHGFLRNGVLVE